MATADPILTPLGEEQARTAHAAWKTELANGLTLPQKFYCSPMARALRTHTITFDGILPASDRKTIILEVRTSSSHPPPYQRLWLVAYCGYRVPRRTLEKSMENTHVTNDVRALR